MNKKQIIGVVVLFLLFIGLTVLYLLNYLELNWFIITNGLLYLGWFIYHHYLGEKQIRGGQSW